MSPKAEPQPEERHFVCASEAETASLARRFGALLKAGDRVILEGELGAGKTFFVRELLRAAGLPEETAVASPTFTLVQRYDDISPPVWHADLYRLGDAGELDELELYHESHILLAEWGMRFSEALRPTWAVQFEITGDTARDVSIIGAADRLRALR